MKGFVVFAAALISVIAIIGAVIMILLPLGFLRMHVIQVVARVYEYDNSQSYLLTLLSKTYNGKTVYSQISENLQTGNPDISFVKNEFDLITKNKCYKLLTVTKDIAVQSDCTPFKYSVQTAIVLPYNPNKLVETLNLVID